MRTYREDRKLVGMSGSELKVNLDDFSEGIWRSGLRVAAKATIIRAAFACTAVAQSTCKEWATRTRLSQLSVRPTPLSESLKFQPNRPAFYFFLSPSDRTFVKFTFDLVARIIPDLFFTDMYLSMLYYEYKIHDALLRV